MNAAPDSRCVECGEPASSVAPMGLCVVCFQKSTGHDAEAYFEQEAANATSTPPTIPLSRTPPSPPGAGSADLKPDQTLEGGRFTLIRRLGRGGMGEVWLAHDRDLTQKGAPFPVALKFLAAEIRRDPEKLDWLRSEVRICHRLNHDNIVKVYDLHATHPSEPAFLAMEYIDGSTLEYRRARKPKGYFPWDDLRTYARQICLALEHAHDRQVFHRDLKPGNVMVLSNGDETKLADFGLARRLVPGASAASFTGRGSGTRGYMSPQQAAGVRPTASDDLYALGATLYQLLTGELPEFREQSAGGKLTRNLVPMSERLAAKGRHRVPDAVEAVVKRCLAEDPLDRPASVYEVSCALGFVDPGAPASPPAAPVAPGPPSPRARRRLWPLAVLLVLAALAAVLLGPWAKPLAKWFEGRIPSSGEPDQTGPATPGTNPPALPPPTPPVAKPRADPPADPTPPGPERWERPGAGSKAPEVVILPHAPPREEPSLPPPRPGPRSGAPWTNSLGMVFRPVGGLPLLVSQYETRFCDLVRQTPELRPDAYKARAGSNQPVVSLTWKRATNFCHWLTLTERQAGRLRDDQRYRLPTVAEWYHAAQLPLPESGPGSRSKDLPGPFLWGPDWPPPSPVGNLLGEETRGIPALGIQDERIWSYRDGHPYPAPSGRFLPNPYGLYDLIGNVWELCADGPTPDRCWMVGGSFDTGSREKLRLSYRRVGSKSETQPRTDAWDVGFRCVLDP